MLLKLYVISTILSVIGALIKIYHIVDNSLLSNLLLGVGLVIFAFIWIVVLIQILKKINMVSPLWILGLITIPAFTIPLYLIKNRFRNFTTN